MNPKNTDFWNMEPKAPRRSYRQVTGGTAMIFAFESPLENALQIVASTVFTEPFEQRSDATDQIKSDLAYLRRINQQLLTRVNDLQQQLESRPVKWAMTIYDLEHPQLTLTRPFSVVVEEYPGGEIVGVRFLETESYVEAASVYDALNEIKEEIVDLYLELSAEDVNHLGRLPLRWRTLLSNLIVEKAPPDA